MFKPLLSATLLVALFTSLVCWADTAVKAAYVYVPFQAHHTNPSRVHRQFSAQMNFGQIGQNVDGSFLTELCKENGWENSNHALRHLPSGLWQVPVPTSQIIVPTAKGNKTLAEILATPAPSPVAPVATEKTPKTPAVPVARPAPQAPAVPVVKPAPTPAALSPPSPAERLKKELVAIKSQADQKSLAKVGNTQQEPKRTVQLQKEKGTIGLFEYRFELWFVAAAAAILILAAALFFFWYFFWHQEHRKKRDVLEEHDLELTSNILRILGEGGKEGPSSELSLGNSEADEPDFSFGMPTLEDLEVMRAYYGYNPQDYEKIRPRGIVRIETGNQAELRVRVVRREKEKAVLYEMPCHSYVSGKHLRQHLAGVGSHEGCERCLSLYRCKVDHSVPVDGRGAERAHSNA